MATASISGSKVVFSTQVPLAQAPTVEQKTSVAFKKPAALSSGQVLFCKHCKHASKHVRDVSFPALY